VGAEGVVEREADGRRGLDATDERVQIDFRHHARDERLRSNPQAQHCVRPRLATSVRPLVLDDADVRPAGLKAVRSDIAELLRPVCGRGKLYAQASRPTLDGSCMGENSQFDTRLVDVERLVDGLRVEVVCRAGRCRLK